MVVVQNALKSSRIRDIETVVGMSSNGSRVLQIGRRHSGVFLNTCRKSGSARFVIRLPVTWGESLDIQKCLLRSAVLTEGDLHRTDPGCTTEALRPVSSSKSSRHFFEQQRSRSRLTRVGDAGSLATHRPAVRAPLSGLQSPNVDSHLDQRQLLQA